MIRALIFDLDETLINRHETMRVFLIEQHQRFPKLADCDADVFAQTCLSFQKNGYADKLDAFTQACAALGNTDPQLPQELFTDFKANYGTKAVAFDGTLALIETLSKDFTLGLVTNGRTVGQKAKLESVGLTPYFSSIVISEAHGAKKPDPSLFNTSLDELGVSAKEAIFIGDNPSADIAPAKALGMYSIWMRSESFDAPERTDAIVDGVHELESAISELCKVAT